MFESVFSSILNSTVGTFLKDVGPEQLKISLGGALHLENVEVKPEAFDFLQLPVAVRFGRVGVLDVQLSWTGLTSRPIKVTLKDVFIVVGVAEDKSVDPEELKARMIEQRLQALMNWEMLRFPEKDASDQSSGTLQNMIATIIDHITIDVQHVHVMVEGEGLNVGVVVEEIKVFPVNDKDEQVVKCIDTSVHGKRRIEVNNFGIYVNSDPEILIASTRRFLDRRAYAVKNPSKTALQLYDLTKEKETALVSHSKLIRAPNERYEDYLDLIFQDLHHVRWQYILEPMSILVRLIMRKKGNKFLQEQTPVQAAMETSVMISSIVFTVQQIQYQSLLRLVSMISNNPMAMTMVAEQLSQDTAVLGFEQQVIELVKAYMDARGMDIEKDKVNPNAQGEKNVLQFVEDLPHHAAMIRDAQTYMSQYKLNLLHYSPPTKEQEEKMRQLEKEYTIGQLLGWRNAAIAIAGYEYKTEEVTWHVKPNTSFFKSLFGGAPKSPKPERTLEDWKLKAVVLFPDHLEDLEIVPKSSEGIHPTFPLILADVKLQSVELALVGANLARTHTFKLDNISTQYIMRTDNAQLLFNMNALQAIDHTHTGPYGAWMSTQGDQAFIEMDMVMGDKAVDPSNNFDLRLGLRIRPVHVTFVPRTVSALSKFFTPPEDLSIGTAALNAFSERYVSAKKSMQTSVVNSLANRSRMCLDISIAAPLIIVPAVVHKTKDKFHTLYVNIGTLEVKMTPPPMSMVKDNKALLLKSKIDNSIISNRSVEEKIERFFDAYEVNIHDMCVYVKDHTVPRTRNDEIIRPFVMTLKASLSLMDDSGLGPEDYAKRQNMPGMVLDVFISPISVVAAPVLTSRILRLGAKVQAELAEAFGESSETAVIIEPSTSAHIDALEHIVDTHATRPTPVVEEDVNKQTVSLAVMAHLEAFNVEVINDHMFNLPLPVLTFSMRDLICTLSMRTKDMSAFVVLGALDLQDHVALPRDGKQFLLATQPCNVILPRATIVSGAEGVDTYAFAVDLLYSVLKRSNVQREQAFLTLSYIQANHASPMHALADMVVNMNIGTFTLQVNRSSIPTLALFTRQLVPPFPTYEDVAYGKASLDMKIPVFSPSTGIDLFQVATLGEVCVPLEIVEVADDSSTKAAERETEFIHKLTNITDDEIDLVFYGFSPLLGRSFVDFDDATELQARVSKFHSNRTLIEPLKSEELDLSRQVKLYIDKKRAEMDVIAARVTAGTASSHDQLRVQQYVNLRTKLVLMKLLSRLQFLDTNIGNFEEKMVVRDAIREIKQKLLARRNALISLRHKERASNHMLRVWSGADQCTTSGGVAVLDPVGDSSATALFAANNSQLKMLRADKNYGHIFDLYNYDPVLHTADNMTIPAGLVKEELKQLYNNLNKEHFFTATVAQAMPLSMDVRISMQSLQMRLVDCVDDDQFLVMRYAIDGLLLNTSMSRVATNVSLTLDGMTLGSNTGSNTTREYISALLTHAEDISTYRSSLTVSNHGVAPDITNDNTSDFFRDITVDSSTITSPSKAYKTFTEAAKKRTTARTIEYDEILFSDPSKKLMFVKFSMLNGETVVLDDIDEFEYYSLNDADLYLGDDVQVHGFDIAKSPVDFEVSNIGKLPFTSPVLLHKGKPVAPMRVATTMSGARVVFTQKSVDTLMQYISKLDKLGAVLSDGLPAASSFTSSAKKTGSVAGSAGSRSRAASLHSHNDDFDSHAMPFDVPSTLGGLTVMEGFVDDEPVIIEQVVLNELALYQNPLFTELNALSQPFSMLFDLSIVFEDMSIIVPVHSTSPEILLVSLGQLQISSENSTIYSPPAVTIGYGTNLAEKPSLTAQQAVRMISSGPPSVRPSFIRKMTFEEFHDFEKSHDDSFSLNESSDHVVVSHEVSLKLPMGKLITEDVAWSMSEEPVIGAASETLCYEHVKVTFAISMNHTTVSSFGFVDNDGTREAHTAPKPRAHTYLRYVPVCFFDGLKIHAANQVYVPTSSSKVSAVNKSALFHHQFQYSVRKETKDWMVLVTSGHSNIVLSQASLSLMLSLLNTCDNVAGNLQEASTYKPAKFASPMPTNILNLRDVDILLNYEPKYEAAVANLKKVAEAQLKKQDSSSKGDVTSKKMLSPKVVVVAPPVGGDVLLDAELQSNLFYQSLTVLLPENTDLELYGFDKNSVVVAAHKSVASVYLRRFLKAVYAPASNLRDDDDNMSVHSRLSRISRVSKYSRRSRHSARSRYGGSVDQWNGAFDNKPVTTNAVQGQADPMTAEVRLEFPAFTLMLTSNVTKDEAPSMAFGVNTKVLFNMEKSGSMIANVLLSDITMVSSTLPIMNLSDLGKHLCNVPDNRRIIMPFSTKVLYTSMPKSLIATPVNTSTSIIPVHPRFRYVENAADNVKPLDLVPTRLNDGKIKDTEYEIQDLNGAAMYAEVNIDDILMKVSYTDYEHVMKCIGVLTMPQFNTTAAASDAATTSTAAPTANANANTAGDATVITTPAGTTAIANSYGDMQVKVNIRLFDITLVNDSIPEYATPFLKVSCPSTYVDLVSFVHSQNIKVTTTNSIQYYNGTVVDWEPLLEPVTFNVMMAQDALRGMKQYLNTEGPLDLNITRSMLDGVNQTSAMFAEASNTMYAAISESAAAITELIPGQSHSTIYNNPVVQEELKTEVLKFGESVDGSQLHANLSTLTSNLMPSFIAAPIESKSSNDAALSFVRLCNYTELPLYHSLGFVSEIDSSLLAHEPSEEQIITSVRAITKLRTEILFNSGHCELHDLVVASRGLAAAILAVCCNGYLPGSPESQMCVEYVRDTITTQLLSGVFDDLPLVSKRRRVLWGLMVLNSLQVELARIDIGVLGSRMDTSIYAKTNTSSHGSFAGYGAHREAALHSRVLNLQLSGCKPFSNISLDSLNSNFFVVPGIGEVVVSVEVVSGVKTVSVHSTSMLVNVLDTPIQINQDIILPGGVYYLPVTKPVDQVTLRPVCVTGMDESSVERISKNLLRVLQTQKGSSVQVGTPYDVCDPISFATVENGSLAVCKPVAGSARPKFVIFLQVWKQNGTTHIALCPPVNIENHLCEIITVGLVNNNREYKMNLSPASSGRVTTGIAHAVIDPVTKKSDSALQLQMTLKIGREENASLQCMTPFVIPLKHDGSVNVNLSGTKDAFAVTLKVKHNASLVKGIAAHRGQYPRLETLYQEYVRALTSQAQSPLTSQCTGDEFSAATFVGSRMSPSAKFAAVTVTLSVPIWIIDATPYNLVAANSKVGFTDLQPSQREKSETFRFVSIEEIQSINFKDETELHEAMLRTQKRDARSGNDAMFSRASMLSLKEKSKIMIKSFHMGSQAAQVESAWSESFNPQVVGNTVQLALKQGNREVMVSGTIRAAPAPFSDTKILILSPGILVINKLPLPIALRQFLPNSVASSAAINTEQDVVLKPLEMNTFHWEDSKKSKLANFKMLTWSDPDIAGLGLDNVEPQVTNTQMSLYGNIISTTDEPPTTAANNLERGNVITVSKEKVPSWTQGVWDWSGHLDLQKPGDNVLLLHNKTSNQAFMANVRVLMSCPDVVGAAGNAFTVIFEPYNLSFSRYRLENRTRFDTVNIAQAGSNQWITIPPMQTSLYAYDTPRDTESLQVQAVRGDCSAFATFKADKFGHLGKLSLKESSENSIDENQLASSKMGGSFGLSSAASSNAPLHVSLVRDGPTSVFIFSNVKDNTKETLTLLADTEDLVQKDEEKHDVGLHTYKVAHGLERDHNAITIRSTGTILTEVVIPAGTQAGENGRFLNATLREDYENSPDSEAELLPYLYVPRSQTAVSGSFAGMDLAPFDITLDTLLNIYPFLEVQPKVLTELEAPEPRDIADAIIARHQMLKDLPLKYAKILAQSVRVQTLRSHKGMDEYKNAVQSVSGPATYLLIHVHAARYLASSKMNGLADTYAVVSFNGTEYKTNVSVNTINPLWNMSVLVALPEHIANNMDTMKKFSIKVTVWHRNRCLSDNFLGGTVIGDLDEAFRKREIAVAAAKTVAQDDSKDSVTSVVENIMEDQQDPAIEGVEEVILDNVHLKQPSSGSSAVISTPAVTKNSKERISFHEVDNRDGWVPLHSSMQTKRSSGEIKVSVTVLGQEFEKQEKLLQLMTEDFEKDLLALKQIHEQYSNALRGLDVGVIDLDTLLLLPFVPLPKRDATEYDVGCCSSSVPKVKKQELKQKKRRENTRKKVNAKLNEVVRKVVFTKFGDVEVPTAHAGNCSVPASQLQPFLTHFAEVWLKAENIQKARMEMLDIKLNLGDIIINQQHLDSLLKTHSELEPTRMVCVMECNGHVVTKQIGVFKPHEINMLKQRKPVVQQLVRGFLEEIKLRVQKKHPSKFHSNNEVMEILSKVLLFEKTLQTDEFLFSVPKWLLETSAGKSYGVNVKMLIVGKYTTHLPCYYSENKTNGVQRDIFDFASTGKGQVHELVECVETKSILLQDYIIPFEKLNFIDKDGQENKEGVYRGPYWFSEQGVVQDHMHAVLQLRDKVLSLCMARAAKKRLNMEDIASININVLKDDDEEDENANIEDGNHTVIEVKDVLSVGKSVAGERKKSSIKLTENSIVYTIKDQVSEFAFLPKSAVLANIVAAAMPSSSLDERIVMDVTVHLPHIGLSMIDTFNGFPEEVMYFSLSGMEINLADSHAQRVIEFMLRRFQLDQQCAEGNFAQDEDRIILGASMESIQAGKPMLHISATQEKTDPSYNGFVFSHVNFLMQALEVQVEEDVLWRLLAFAGDVVPSLADQDDSGVLGAIVQNNTVQYALQEKYASQPLYYVEVLQIQPILLFLTFRVSAKSNVQGPINPISIALSALTGILGNIDAAPLCMNALVMQDACGDMQTLMQPITQFYVTQGIKEAYKILGSIEVLGNPVSLVNGLGKGVKDFFYEPAQGLVQSPKQFGLGLARGTSNLIKGVASSVLGAASKITNSVGSGVAVFTMDEEFAAKRRVRNRKRVKHAGQGVAQGAAALTHGIFSGLKGIVMDPIKGARQQGVTGFMKGVVKGLTGVVTKTASGAVDFVSLTLKGVANTFTDQDEGRGRARLTRFQHPSYPLQPYNDVTALAGNVLALVDHRTLNTKGFLKGALKSVQSSLELQDNNTKNEIIDKITYVERDLNQLSHRQAAVCPEFTDMARLSADGVLEGLQKTLKCAPASEHAKIAKLAVERMGLYVQQAQYDEQLVYSAAWNNLQGSEKDVIVQPLLVMVSSRRLQVVSRERTLRAVTRGSKVKPEHVLVNTGVGNIKDIYSHENTVIVQVLKSKSSTDLLTFVIPMANAAQAHSAAIELHAVLSNAEHLDAHRSDLLGSTVSVTATIDHHLDSNHSDYPNNTLKPSQWIDALRYPGKDNQLWTELTGPNTSVITMLFEKQGKVYSRAFADTENIVLL